MNDAAQTPPPPATRSPRWMRIALIVSVALNMLILGFVGGAAWNFGRHGWRDHGGQRIERFIAMQPAAAQDAIRSSWQRAREKRRELRNRMRESRRKMTQILTADPFDRSAYDAERAQALATLAELRGARLDAIADIAGTVPAAQRRAFVEALEHRWHRWRRFNRDDSE